MDVLLEYVPLETVLDEAQKLKIAAVKIPSMTCVVMHPVHLLTLSVSMTSLWP